MATEGIETVLETNEEMGNRDTESFERVEYGEIEEEEEEEEEEDEEKEDEAEKKQQEIDDQSSPRGVLEVPVTGSDSDNTDRSSNFGIEKSVVARGVTAGDLAYGNLHWKKMFGQVKKTSSVWTVSTISLIMGHGPGHDVSKKTSRKKLPRNHISEEDIIDDGEIVVPKPSWRGFSYEELNQATDNFSPDKLIGKGGHAEVYKGCLSDGQIIAVKKLVKEKKNDEDRVGDFLSELGILAHIEHPNAAKLIGFSADGGLYLVLQFLPHGSLGTVLHGSGKNLDWKTRYKVAIGIAEGLQYLHSGCQKRIIHRDITASNILLSEDYEAQISDFGLAKWLPDKWAHLVVSPIEGTFGYMAPEYFMHGIVHEKTDVFAFGVLLLELITGRRAVDYSSRQSLVMWAKPLLENNNISEIADPRLGGVYDVIEIKRAMFAASTCIHQSPSMRPNMKRAIQLLKGENGVDMKQMSRQGRSLFVDACDYEDYSSTTYLKDLNRHMELVME